MTTEEKKTVEEKNPLGIIDILLGKAVSRKLLVWATATTALFLDVIPPEQWMNLSIVYIGGQAVVDGIKMIKAQRGE